MIIALEKRGGGRIKQRIREKEGQQPTFLLSVCETGTAFSFVLRRRKLTHSFICYLFFFFLLFSGVRFVWPIVDPSQVIRPPPPDLVQQHTSPLPLATAGGGSPLHRPSPSPSPPYATQQGKTTTTTSAAAAAATSPQQQHSGPGRPNFGGGTTFATTMRERRNSTSSVISTTTAGRHVINSSGTSVNAGPSLSFSLTCPSLKDN